MSFKSQGLKQFWKERKEIEKEIRERGECVIDVRKIGTVLRVHVLSPYNPEFIDMAKDKHNLDGYWRHRTKTWSFALGKLEAVIKACQQVYGDRNVTVLGYDKTLHGEAYK